MRSIIKPFPKARYSSAFSSKIIVKDLFYVAYARNLRGNLHVKSKDLNGPEIYLRFYFPKIFLAKQHLKEDFLQRFLALAQPKKYPFNIRLNSDDPMIRVLCVLRG